MSEQNPEPQGPIPSSYGVNAYGPLRSLGERQLQIQFTLGSMYDTQAMGILGLNAALAAAAIAGDALIGAHWWAALVGLAFSSVVCGVSLRTRAEQTGPDILLLAESAEHATAKEMDEVIVRFVGGAFAVNDGKLQLKSELVWVAIALLVATVATTIGVVLAF